MQLSPTDSSHGPSRRPERRFRPRVRLAWKVRLVRIADQQTAVTETADLSSGGFFCCSPFPFRHGDALECTFRLPAGHGPRPMELHCKASVMRVGGSDRGPGYGIACRVDDHILSEAMRLDTRSV